MTKTVLQLTSKNDVLQLNSETFPKVIAANRMVLLLLFYEVVPSCNRFVPIFEHTAHSGRDSGVVFAQVDMDESPDLREKFGLSANEYPALMLFEGIDTYKRYVGAMTEDKILSYLERQDSPVVSQITTSNLQDFKDTNDVLVVGYFERDDEKSSDAFTDLAEEMRDEFLFGIASGDTIAKKEGIKTPSIAVYTKFEKEMHVLKLSGNHQPMRVFVKTYSRPLIIRFDPIVHSIYFGFGLPLLYILVDTPEDAIHFSELAEQLAKRYRSRMIFFLITKPDLSKFKNLADTLFFDADHLSPKEFPTFIIREPIKNLRYRFDTHHHEISEENLFDFIEGFRLGQLKSTIKSQSRDVLPPKTPVVDITALTFEQVIMDPEKDVFLQYCTSWCGGCKQVRPIYEALAKLYAGDEELKDKLTIATMDIEKNDFTDRDILGVPWFKLYPKGRKENPVTYCGARTVEDMVKFIGEEGDWKAAPKMRGEGVVGEGMSSILAL